MTVNKTNHTVLTYEILNVSAAPPNLLAVFAYESDNGDGFFDLCFDRVHAIGVAKVRYQDYRQWTDEDGRTHSEEREKPEFERQTVSLILLEGQLSVCEEVSNFGGICEVGQYPADAVRRLQRNYNLRLRAVIPQGPTNW